MTVQESLPGLAALSAVKQEWINEVKRISMLHVATLGALHQLAAASRGTILEFGPYVGGSTVAMAEALKDDRPTRERPRRIITVEGGGADAHPELPSTNIAADLNSNQKRAGVDRRVEVIEGWTTDLRVIRRLRRLLKSDAIGMFVLDANGLIRPELLHWGPYCRAPCFLVIDDYIESGDQGLKSPSIQPVLEQLMREGFLEEMGVLPWGTWFGRIVKPLLLPTPMTASGPDRWSLHPPFVPMGSTGWTTSLALDAMPDIVEKLTAPKPSALVVLEDGKPLGPGDAPIDDIKERGRGAFNQWGGPHSTLLMFTTSDNSDPNRNGRAYALELRSAAR